MLGFVSHVGLLTVLSVDLHKKYQQIIGDKKYEAKILKNELETKPEFFSLPNLKLT
ncbi:MAG: hypothetical protein QM652_10020 [Legionella sp.]|uniref:hypothetical protein n=1 Tax=Legionella sp. TaxID=459 RepID=UPI0039E5269B